MKVKAGQEQTYAEWRERNTQDAYSAACVHYLERWADLLEHEIEIAAATESSADVIARCAKSLSHEADSEGITGFMYGCVVAALAEFWQHGEELRRWHNLAEQLHDEGEKANREGGTLNPALITVTPR